MSGATFVGIRACVFDAYGTLFDFGSAATGCRDVLGDKADRLTALWRDKQLQYTWLRTLQGRHVDFWQVTADALDFALETLTLGQAGLRDRLMDLYLALNIFPEVPEVLRRIQAAGLKTAILSNGTPAMLHSAVEHSRIGRLVGSVLSVEEVGFSSRIQRYISLRSTAYRSKRAESCSCHQMPGMLTLPLRLECASCGAIVVASLESGYQAHRIGTSKAC